MDRTGLIRTLTAHVQIQRNDRCSCGWRGDVSKGILDPNNIHAQHRAHIADMILEAQEQK